MIWVHRSGGRRRWATVVVVALGAGAVGWWAWSPSAETAEARATSPLSSIADPQAVMRAGPPAAGPLAAVAPPVARSTPTDITPTPMAANVPEGMTAEQVRALHEALRDHPQRDAEIARVTDYMAYASRVERYRALLAQGKAGLDEARALGRTLLAELPTRAARGEISSGEATLMQQSLFETLDSDAGVRVQQRLALRDALPVPPDLQAQADLNARYKREEAALLADWQARPRAERDSAALGAALEDLRQSVFSNAGSTGPAPTSNGDTR